MEQEELNVNNLLLSPFLLAKRNQFRAIRSGPADERATAKMSHRPTKVSLHVEARILLTTVAGPSSMDL
jgi:hypothetical protein